LVDPKVFISHSSHPPGARNARLKLERALQDAGFGVLVDYREIKLGDEWRRKVFNMVFECDAAVVVLSKPALTSNYVLLEIAWLTARRYLDDGFVIIPVLVPPVNPAHLDRTPLQPMQLNELQQGRISEKVVERIIKRLAPVKAALMPSPIDRLVKNIALWLPERRDRIDDIAIQLGIDIQGLSPELSRCRIARALIDQDLASLPKTFEALAPNLNDRIAADRLLAVLACSWVDPEAIAPIPAVMRGPGGERGVALNCTEDLTAKAYLQRAHARYPSWPTLKTTNQGGPDQFGRLVREIRIAYRAQFPHEILTDAEVDKRLGRDPGDLPSVVIVPGMVSGDVLEQLRDHYRHFGYFLMTEDEDPVRVRSELTGVTVLEPALAAAREREFLERYEQARSRVAASLL
jgi:TIR domain